MKINDLLSYSGIKGCYFIEEEGVLFLEKISRQICKKAKLRKIRCPLFLKSEELKKQAVFRDFKKQCFKIQDKDYFLKPTSELILLEKVKKDFLYHENIGYYMDGSVFRKETCKNGPGIRHDEIMFFMEGHFFSNKEEDILFHIKKVEKIFDSIFKRNNINFFKTYRPPEDLFIGAKTTLAYNYITSFGSVLQIATIHNLGTFFTSLKKILKDKEKTFSCSYGLSERILFPLVDNDNNLINPFFRKKYLDNRKNLPSILKKQLFIRDKYHLYTQEKKIDYHKEEEKLMLKKYKLKIKEDLKLQFFQRFKKTISFKSGKVLLGSWKKKNYFLK